MGSLRDRQVEALKAMLTLDSPGGPKNNNVEPSWKVLVYDKTGKHDLILVKIITMSQVRISWVLFCQSRS